MERFNDHGQLPRPQLLVLLFVAMVLFGIVFPAIYPTQGTILRASGMKQPISLLPGGGRLLFPRSRLIALYGTPNAPELGALGEQSCDAAIARVKSLAAMYQPLMSERALPTLEIITTVASSNPMDDGSYSYAIDTAMLHEWVMSAQRQGVYVVLDLQPGRTDFLTQAKRLEPLLEQPNVGLALDPEWRLGPSQVPLVQIGSVSIDEVNQTAAWLAGITAERHLPQKLFLLHQFQLSMISGRALLDTSHAQLAYAVQMDGQGTQPEKLDTWSAITASPPAGVMFGWKNFYRKDEPIRSPEETMSLDPKPWYVSYQ